jgi:hypothetical protein
MANTEAESVDDMVAASRSEGTSAKWIFVHDMPDRYHTNNPVSRAVRNTPIVDSTIPGVTMGLMSLYLVSIPPEKRMMLKATILINWAIYILSNCMPKPSHPKSIPTIRNKSKAGTPNL